MGLVTVMNDGSLDEEKLERAVGELTTDTGAATYQQARRGDYVLGWQVFHAGLSDEELRARWDEVRTRHELNPVT